MTVGDGLVSQVPAFLISMATAMLITRTNRDSDLAERRSDAAFFPATGACDCGCFPRVVDFYQYAAVAAYRFGGCLFWFVLDAFEAGQ